MDYRNQNRIDGKDVREMQAIKNPVRTGRIFTFFTNFDSVVNKGCYIIHNRSDLLVKSGIIWSVYGISERENQRNNEDHYQTENELKRTTYLDIIHK